MSETVSDYRKYLDPRTLARISSLDLRARLIVEGLTGGMHRSPYQGISVELINKRIFEEGAGLSVADFPTTVDGLPALCATIKEKTGTLCTIRLTVNDLLSQMVYEGGVEVFNDAGTFAFDSPEGVAWLQMYVDMVKAETVDNSVLMTGEDRVGLLVFSAGQSAFSTLAWW